MKNWITYPKIEGMPPRQAHCDLPQNTYERELGKEGFFGPVSHMVHAHPPTAWQKFEGPLRPRCFALMDLDVPFEVHHLPSLLYNQDCVIRFWQFSQSMQSLYRNADGDEVIFVHAGQGDFFCDYGHMRFREGDYLVIPRGTMWRVVVDEPCAFLLVEATNHSYFLPDKGLLGPQAIFDTALLETPQLNDVFKAQKEEKTWQVHIKRLFNISTITYPFNPLDALGWQGSLSVVKINWRDIRPLMSHRYHLPPSVHTTFLSDRFVICTFCPRPIETDPGALKVPFFHNNDDFDEVLFYHQGDFFSRDNIKAGMLSFHPCGFTHGPHPKALAKSQTNPSTTTDEVAVMIDARNPLKVNEEVLNGVEWGEYASSWQGYLERI